MKHGDPYDTMGYGLIAYRQTILLFAYTFVLLTILTAPICAIYGQGEYQGGSEKSQYTLGHLGYAKV